MKEIIVRQYTNAKFRFINADKIVVETDEFRFCNGNELIPFLVEFDKEKACWVHAKFENNDLSPFKKGTPVADSLNLTLFDQKIAYLKTQKNVEEETIQEEDVSENDKVEELEL